MLLLSVRDDNIDEISDRETLENADSSEETAPNTQTLVA